MATDPYFIELLMKMTNKNATLGRYNKRDTNFVSTPQQITTQHR